MFLYIAEDGSKRSTPPPLVPAPPVSTHRSSVGIREKWTADTNGNGVGGTAPLEST